MKKKSSFDKSLILYFNDTAFFIIILTHQ